MSQVGFCEMRERELLQHVSEFKSSWRTKLMQNRVSTNVCHHVNSAYTVLVEIVFAYWGSCCMIDMKIRYRIESVCAGFISCQSGVDLFKQRLQFYESVPTSFMHTATRLHKEYQASLLQRFFLRYVLSFPGVTVAGGFPAWKYCSSLNTIGWRTNDIDIFVQNERYLQRFLDMYQCSVIKTLDLRIASTWKRYHILSDVYSSDEELEQDVLDADHLFAYEARRKCFIETLHEQLESMSRESSIDSTEDLTPNEETHRQKGVYNVAEAFDLKDRALHALTHLRSATSATPYRITQIMWTHFLTQPTKFACMLACPLDRLASSS